MRAAENILQLMQTNKPAKLEIILTGIIATLISTAFVPGRNMSISQTIELSRIDVCAFLLIAIVAKAKLSLNYSCFLNGAHPFCFPPGGRITPNAEKIEPIRLFFRRETKNQWAVQRLLP